MSRFSRINAIWRKELVDTLRDRRTLIAMVLVPMVLYPALMLGSLQALELQVMYLRTQTYEVAVDSEQTLAWLRGVLDEDRARQAPDRSAANAPEGADEVQRTGVREKPPEYHLEVVDNVEAVVTDGTFHLGVITKPTPKPQAEESQAEKSRTVRVIYDESEIRSQIALSGLEGVLDREKMTIVRQRLAEYDLSPDFIQPYALQEINIASPEKMAGSVLGRIVPLILIMMTITGAIYPAIDLTAGERERGTLETLMAAPVPPLDLISGKFVVVALIGMLSAVLNLLSIGGTIYLGGLGEVLTQGEKLIFPLSALPWVLVLLLPLAVLFSAVLLAVSSFARSFKEAQNYIVPVMIAALIPGVVGILPATELQGPIVLMPVANIVVLTRELFMGQFDPEAIFLVLFSTCLYAGAAVAVAGRLFGQEAVLFADSASIKTLFQRRYFTPRSVPSAAHVLLTVAIIYTLNFYLQNSFNRAGLSGKTMMAAINLVMLLLFVAGPLLALQYSRVNVAQTMRLRRPPLVPLLAAVLFGLSSWLLVHHYFVWQEMWLPQSQEFIDLARQQLAWTSSAHPLLVVVMFAMIPAICEELLFRGYALSGLRGAMRLLPAMAVSAFAFAMFHYSVHRLIPTFLLGMLFAWLVVRSGSIWPAVIAHFLHNALVMIMSEFGPWHAQLTELWGGEQPPLTWTIAALTLFGTGLVLCTIRARHRPIVESAIPAPAAE